MGPDNAVVLCASASEIADNVYSWNVHNVYMQCQRPTLHISFVLLIHFTPQPDFNPASLRGMTAETLRTYLTRDIPGGGHTI